MQTKPKYCAGKEMSLSTDSKCCETAPATGGTICDTTISTNHGASHLHVSRERREHSKHKCKQEFTETALLYKCSRYQQLYKPRVVLAFCSTFIFSFLFCTHPISTHFHGKVYIHSNVFNKT